jgi:hypothetical protein
VGGFCVLGNDVDNAVDSVRAPNGASRTANHFDSINVLKQRVLNPPINAGKARGISTAAIDEHQKRL